MPWDDTWAMSYQHPGYNTLHTWPRSDRAAQVNISFWHDLLSLFLSLTDGSPCRSTITLSWGSLCWMARMFLRWQRCWTTMMSHLLSTQAFAVSSRLRLALRQQEIPLQTARTHYLLQTATVMQIYPANIAARWQIILWWHEELPMIPTECCLDRPISIRARATTWKCHFYATTNGFKLC